MQTKTEKQRILEMLHDAKTALGLQTLNDLAREMGVVREALYQWSVKEKIPVDRAIQLEKMLAQTRLPLTRHVIAPWAYR